MKALNNYNTMWRLISRERTTSWFPLSGIITRLGGLVRRKRKWRWQKWWCTGSGLINRVGLSRWAANGRANETSVSYHYHFSSGVGAGMLEGPGALLKPFPLVWVFIWLFQDLAKACLDPSLNFFLRHFTLACCGGFFVSFGKIRPLWNGTWKLTLPP